MGNQSWRRIPSETGPAVVALLGQTVALFPGACLSRPFDCLRPEPRAERLDAANAPRGRPRCRQPARVWFTCAVHKPHWHGRKLDLPRCGQVIVFFLDGFNSLLVKRVIGVPGDIIEMRANRLLINGQPIPCESEEISAGRPGQRIAHSSERIGLDWHPILVSKTPSSSQSFGPIVVPDGHYFRHGRIIATAASDSRVFGFVPVENIVGQATAVVFSLDPASRNFPRAACALHAVP